MSEIEVVNCGDEVSIHIDNIKIVLTCEIARELAEKMTFLM